MLSAAHSLRARQRRVRRDEPDAGITLAELIVTMTLMMIVGTLALGWMVGSVKATDRTNGSSTATAGARAAVSSWSAMLQVATTPTTDPTVRNLTVTADKISFNAQLNTRSATCSASGCPTGAATLVTLEQRTQTTGSSTVTQLVQTLGSNSAQVVVPSDVSHTGCLFTLYNAAGTSLGCSPTAAVANTAARVDLTFVVTPSGAAARTFGTSISLPGNFG